MGKHLYLDNKKLTKYDKELPSDLEELDMRNNHLTNFDLKLPLFLKSLNINNNNLTRFDVVLPHSLTELSLAHNKIAIFSSKIPSNLKYLNLSNNKIARLDVSSLSLKFVLLGNNDLFSLKCYNSNIDIEINVKKTKLKKLNSNKILSKVSIPYIGCIKNAKTYDKYVFYGLLFS